MSDSVEMKMRDEKSSKIGNEVVIDMKSEAKIDPLTISIHDIGFEVPVIQSTTQQGGLFKKKNQVVPKAILKGISGVFRPGRLTAVMGASGAGKTSLLNVLAGEVHKGTITGQLKINGEEIKTGKQMKNISGFVFQDDVILDTMTVKEAITMSAILRLPQSIPLEEKMKRVNDLLVLLRLEKAKDTIIGNTTVKGISGGERKRTALAMEMITNPSILFLDEPTSGLDTFTAFNVCDILRNLARSGRTVIATIHQPSSETFFLFDDLCLLAEGRIMYFGPVKGVVDYFANLGFPCPQYTNPADYIFMSILNPEKGPVDKPVESSVPKLLESWVQSKENEQMNQELIHVESKGVKIAPKYKSDFFTQIKYLFGRALKNALRNKFIVRVKFGQSCFIAILIGLIYLNVTRLDFAELIQNVGGVLFFVSVNMVMGSSIGVLSIFALEKAVFIREHSNGYYGLGAYFFSKILTELPFQILFPTIQTCILYPMVRLATVYWYQPIIFAISAILLTCCGTALGIFFASLFSDLTLALAVTPMVLLPLMIFSGLFVNNGSIPVYFDWIKYLSPIKYGFEALLKNQFAGFTFTQTNAANPNVKVIIGGDQVIQQFGMNNDNLSVAVCLIVLASMYLGLLLMAFFVLKRAVRTK